MSQSLDRATDLLEFVATGSWTLREIAERSDVHRSTVFRQLKALEDAGFVIHRTDGTWAVGMRLIAIAQQAIDRLDLRRVASGPLHELHREVGNTVHLAQLVGDGVFYVDKIDDPEGVRMSSRIGRQVVAARTGVGKAILAQLPPDRVDAVVGELDPAARRELDAALDRVRAQGWAPDDGEFEEFVACIAVPIVAPTGLVGAVSVSAIRAVTPIAELETRLDAVRRCADLIVKELG
jgi:DNA-binding IclR family transcriptional regulator